MKAEIKIPAVGESVNEATIAEWLKKDGDAVSRDDVLLNLETDKANVEVVAEHDGVLQIQEQDGATVSVGSVIGFIDTEAKASSGNGANGSNGASHGNPDGDFKAVESTPASMPPLPNSAPPSTTPSATPTGKAIPILVPAVGESVTEATVGDWLKDDGAAVRRDDVLVSLETDKASVEIVAEHDGVLKIEKQSGETIGIGTQLGSITPGGTPSASPTPPAIPSDAPTKSLNVETTTANPQDLNDLSPAARHAAMEHNVNPSQVSGTGKDGRVTKADIMNYAKSAPQPASQPASSSASASPASSAPAKTEQAKTPAPTMNGGERREKMSTIRKRIAQRLVMAQHTAAILTTFNEVDLTEVKALRAKYKDKFKEKYGVGLGFMGFFTKAVIEALKEYPAVNAFIEGDEIVYHDYANIGVAVGSPRGLVVPVVKNAEHMSIADIEQEIKRLAIKARDGKISIDDMSGGTFTISNGGTYGSLMSTPILNPPQSGILGMHKIEDRPVAVNGNVEIRPMMYIALSYDHRIIDGEGAVKFLVHIKEALEDPARILLEI